MYNQFSNKLVNKLFRFHFKVQLVLYPEKVCKHSSQEVS